MISTISKWGNSLAVRIPQHLAKEIALTEGTQIVLLIEDGNLIVQPRQKKRYSLEELLEQITPDNLHREIAHGTAVGQEIC
ncbi:AbrB/MazE/SpoVT family DNA-binding domain-containing protein [Oscillatoria sp. FACHB-1406]|uniref:AbrB/MazE/SpoVT family DNA-binding domain-containing protein n=1 Tax=Oscillatoria sp. FACHB-1406 TaxID=2692846 RepID=UPI001684E7D7|nr:AbrB/MazE/SpoVT family DNA-binding domain-containing protein [Oscillatoria sp. FACHB-1406]MBD2579970.1 AbrB/MazE/SpoVT family DNA-binding domain-containing protein [Oscillatoria sp. FACHB-1406]